MLREAVKAISCKNFWVIRMIQNWAWQGVKRSKVGYSAGFVSYKIRVYNIRLGQQEVSYLFLCKWYVHFVIVCKMCVNGKCDRLDITENHGSNALEARLVWKPVQLDKPWHRCICRLKRKLAFNELFRVQIAVPVRCACEWGRDDRTRGVDGLKNVMQVNPSRNLLD